VPEKPPRFGIMQGPGERGINPGMNASERAQGPLRLFGQAESGRPVTGIGDR
jgi:hypothetical protein